MGGNKSQLNIFRLHRNDDPPEVLNWKLWLAVFSFAIMGTARGIDEGLISGTLASSSFRDLLHLPPQGTGEYASIQATITSMVQIGSVAGAGLAFVLCDRIGRLWATRELCLIWIVGIIIFMCNNGNLGMVYGGRFVAGLGIGQASVVAPVYLAEISPRALRGLCTTLFGGSNYLGIMIAYFANWGCQLHMSDSTSQRWLVPTSIHLMFATIIFALSFFNCESPRYLIKCGRDSQATRTLARIRNLPLEHTVLKREILDIQEQLEEETNATTSEGWLGILREMFLVPSNLYRVYLGIAIQLLTQWCGAQSITIYAPTFFASVGVQGQNQQLFVTCILGIIKLVGALICAFYLVDVIGRKRSLTIGITIQSFAMLYITLFLTIMGNELDPKTFTSSQKGASIAAIAMVYLCSFGWALGWNGIQYLLNAEIYPLRIRAVSSSLIMLLHFANQYGANRAVPEMLLPRNEGGMGSAGVWWFFSGMTIFGGIWAWFFVPETAGLGLEAIDSVFALRWWQIGRHGHRQLESLPREDDGNSEVQRDKERALHVE